MRSECGKYQKQIPELLLGDLAEEDRHALEEHLAKCPDCRSERESYIRTLDLMRSVDDESVPHHFFIPPQQEISNPWQLFKQMKPIWKAMAAAAAILFLLIGVAAVSRMQIRSDSDGWAVSFGPSNIDVAALKQDILNTAEERSRQAITSRYQKVRSEMESTFTDLTQKQQNELMAALARVDSRLTGRLDIAEAQMKDDKQNLASEIYRTVAQQRAQDLEVINLRFDSFEANNAIKDRQTNALLGTLVDVAELSLRETGGQR
jgi:hypothetical protein